MKVELITNIFVLDDRVFREIYKLIKSDHMSFNSCLRVDDVLIFTLKEPQRLFIVERVEDSYNFKMKSEDGNKVDNFAYLIKQDEVDDLIDKFRKRQTFGWQNFCPMLLLI